MAINSRISIVTVCYNAAETIETAILSVLNQNYTDIEYIIIDGGSTDQTKPIIKKYRDRIAIYISENDSGIYDAMNKALDVATGDYIYFLGADDVLTTTSTILEMSRHFREEHTCYYGNVVFKKKNSLYKFELSKWTLCLRNISHQSIFYPKAYYKFFKYDLNYKIYADHIYNIQLYAHPAFQIKHIDQEVALYNDAGASSSIFDDSYFNDLPQIVNKYLGFKYAVYVWLRFKLFKAKRFLKNES